MSSFDLEEALINFVLALMKAFILVHDIITYPFYLLVYRPWSKTASCDEPVAAKENVSDRLSPWHSTIQLSNESIVKGTSSLSDLFAKITSKYGDKMCLGYRDVFMKDEEVINGTIVLKKIPSPDFKWLTYVQANKRIDDIVKGLIKYKITPDDKVVIFMENRIEFTLVLHAILRLGATAVIINEATADKELTFILNQVNSCKIFTSCMLLDRVDRVVNKLSYDKCVFYAEDATEQKTNTPAIPYSLLVETGASASPKHTVVKRQLNDLALIYYVQCKNEEASPVSEDVAVDAFTPRGVMITHTNLISAIWSLDSLLSGHLRDNKLTDSQFASHMKSLGDLISTYVMLANGIPVAFSTLGTLTDTSDSLKSGSRGDLSCLRAKVINSVPSFLDTIKRQFYGEYDGKKVGKMKKKFFEFALTYKHYWQMKGFNTPLLNVLTFNRLRCKVSNNLQLIVNRIQSELLSPSSESFIRSTVNCSIINGLACDEVCGFFTLESPKDTMTLGSVGTVLPGIKMRLADWSEGGFTTYDLPHSRGQLLIAGPAVSPGYYQPGNEDEKNSHEEKSFIIDESGEKWFNSGFIAEIRSNGQVYVYGKKESMVRLELSRSLLSLQQTAAALRSNEYIRHIFCYANEENNFIIALVNPNYNAISSLSAILDIEEGSLSFKEMCGDPEVQAEVTKSIIEEGLKSGLKKNVLPSKIKLCPEVWTTENNFLLSDSSPNRVKILEFYKKDIGRMFNHSRKFVLPPSLAANNNNNNNNNNDSAARSDVVRSDTTTRGNTTSAVETKSGVEMSQLTSSRRSSSSSSSSSEYSETTMSKNDGEIKSHL